MKTIFISYAREDKKNALIIYNLLKENGFSPWIDIINLLPGQEWEFEIEKAIQNCSIFIACLSKNSISKRGYVQSEFKKAIKVLDMIPEGQIWLVPVRLDICQIPIKFAKLQWLDYFCKDGPEKLIKIIMLQLVLEKDSTFKDKDITIDANQKTNLVENAKNPGMRNKVVNYLIQALNERMDPTERYWIYIAFGEIGGTEAKLIIENGLLEENYFARLGAKSAGKLLNMSS